MKTKTNPVTSTKSGKVGSGSGASAAAKAKDAATETAVANARLVEAIRSFDESKAQTQSYLVEIGSIVQNEQLTRPEIVLSFMEARGITKATAESQFSRMKKILTDPETLEALRTGEIDLKTARENTTKKQQNPSAKKQQENAEKRIATAITTLINSAKETGTDLVTLLNTIKSAAKKAGLK